MKCSLSKYEMQNLISLLHKDYQNLPIQIIGIYNVLQKIRYMWTVFINYFDQPNICKNLMNPKMNGCFIPLSNHIFIDFNEIRKQCNWEERTEEDIFDKKKWMAFVLFHELRHAYQYHIKKKMKKKFESDLSHDNFLLEKDANEFAYRMMKKHKQKIEEILKVGK